MLYVSRLIGSDSAEVLSTDGASVRIYDSDELKKMLGRGIKIGGVHMCWDSSRGRHVVRLCPHGLDPVSEKTERLYGIRFNVTDGMLLSVIAHDRHARTRDVIRLSRVCRAVADNAFQDFKYDGSLTIIVDDVRHSKNSFQCSHVNGNVVFDLREASDSLAWCVYENWFSDVHKDVITKVLLDNDDRFHAFLYEYVCRYGLTPKSVRAVQDLFDKAVSYPCSEKLFLDRHKEKFRKLHDSLGGSLRICMSAEDLRFKNRDLEVRMYYFFNDIEKILKQLSALTLPDNLDNLSLRREVIQGVFVHGCGWRHLYGLLGITNMWADETMELLRMYIVKMNGTDNDCLFWLIGMYKTALRFVRENWKVVYSI